MIARLSIVLLSAGALCAALLLAGCDGGTAEDGAREVVFDVSPLFRSASGEACVTVVEALQLTITEADGSERTVQRALAADEAEIRIPVEVDAGTVTFEAAVRSNNGTLLYTGSTSASLDADGFSVEVPLTAVDAVLKACPAPVPLVLGDAAYRGELRVLNVGSRATSWTATVLDPPLCDGEPCFSLDPVAATVAAGGTEVVEGTALATTLTDAFDVRITSPVGRLDVRFVAENLAPVPETDVVTVLEGGTVAVDVLANDVDPEGDPLSLISVGPASFGTTTQEGDFAVYTADYTPVWAETSDDAFTYIVDAGGRRAEGDVLVQVAPCIVFEESVSSESANVPLYAENGVTAFTRPVQFDPDGEQFVFVQVAPIPQSNDDLGAYLFDAVLEFDWSEQPVHYVRVDVRDEAATINLGINGEDRIIVPSLQSTLPLPPGITSRLEDGKFGPGTRLVLEAAETTPIERLFLGGGEEDGDQNLLILDDLCFGSDAPSEP